MQEEKNKEWQEEETPSTPQVRRSLQGQYTPHLSLGAREGWIEKTGGEVTHLSPGVFAIAPMQNEARAEKRQGRDERETHLSPDL